MAGERELKDTMSRQVGTVTLSHAREQKKRNRRHSQLCTIWCRNIPELNQDWKSADGAAVGKGEALKKP